MDFDPSSSEILDDPHAAYRWLRSNDPVHWSEASQSWVITRYDDVRSLLMDARLSSRRPVASLGATQAVPLGVFSEVPTMSSTDPPTHTRLRGLVKQSFTPSAIQAMRVPAQEIVSDVLDGARAKGRLDLYADLAGSLPTQIIAAMLGVPRKDWPLFRTWSDEIFGAFKGALASDQELRDATRAESLMEEYLREAIASKTPGDEDLISQFKYVRDGGEQLSDDEVLAHCILLLTAGNETTTGTIVNTIAELMERPAIVKQLQANPDLIPAAVDEGLRLVGPAHLAARRARETVELHGRTIRPRDSVMLLVAAANRDPAAFDDPDDFRLDRKPNNHLAFGHGRHFCLGAALTRMEVDVVLATLFSRLHALNREDDQTPEWIGPLLARRVDEVRLVWQDAA